MELDENKFPELKRLVSEVKSGQRVILFPPGIFIFAMTMVILPSACVLCFAATFTYFYAGSEAAVTGVAQLMSMPLILAITLVPGIFAIRGKVRSVNWFKGYSLTICVISVLGVLLNVIYLSNSQTIPFSIALFLGVIAFFSTRSSSFTLLVYYHYFMRKT